jgi:type IV secretion system protein TrbI
LLVCTRPILPDGRSLLLDRLPATDAQGFAGLGGKTDYHWGRVAKAALLSMILGIGDELGSGSDNGFARANRDGAQGTLNDAGQ